MTLYLKVESLYSEGKAGISQYSYKNTMRIKGRPAQTLLRNQGVDWRNLNVDFIRNESKFKPEWA